MEAGRKRIETFFYAESGEIAVGPAWTGWEAVPDLSSEKKAEPRLQSAAPTSTPAELADQRAREEHRAFEQGRQRGFEQGRRAERDEQAAEEAAREQDRIRRVTELLEEFTRERDRYLREVEQQVVKLAMAVAARILRREAQTDPLLAIGAVRVALGQIPAATEVRLLVPGGEVELWTEAIALLPNLSSRPKVVAAEEMLSGDCRIETSLGSADVGIRAQLGEMLGAFFDGVEATPPAVQEPTS